MKIVSLRILMAARFGDMLLEQRRRMGLSIQQVANTIKIRPQIIEFFGDR